MLRTTAVMMGMTPQGRAIGTGTVGAASAGTAAATYYHFAVIVGDLHALPPLTMSNMHKSITAYMTTSLHPRQNIAVSSDHNEQGCDCHNYQNLGQVVFLI